MPDIVPPVAAGFASYLKSDALFATAQDATIAGRWGADAIDTKLVSAIASAADANSEAVRQLTFLSGPLVADEHIVPGRRHDLIGRRVRMRTYDPQPLGYDDAGVIVFVIGAVESGDSDTTTLTVLRRLA